MDQAMDGDSYQNQFFVLQRRAAQALFHQLNNSYDRLCDTLDEVIDVTQIQFGDDESWLCPAPTPSANPINNLKEWLHESTKEDDFAGEDFSSNSSPRNIDTRTFTRPKKRFSRPSIEKYNEQLYGEPSHDLTFDSRNGLASSTISETGRESPISSSKPLQFDLSQPSSSYYFDNILANAPDIDSFQNMSPPSLVNSMCSSTFANLMESSFIKNDPVLREIRDTDYTEMLLQDCEPPMFQSLTESCSSINSDDPESFLKKINSTFRKNKSNDLLDKTFDLTLVGSEVDRENWPSSKTQLNTTQTLTQSSGTTIVNQETPPTSQTFNSNTYRRTPKRNQTFRKTEASEALKMNGTFEMPLDHPVIQSNTLILNKESKHRTLIKQNTIEKLKSDSDTLLTADSNRWISSDDDDKYYLAEDRLNVEEKSQACSTGSADSLDRISSSLSNSSRGSNKILNMADVDAIVEMQERSLQQVMSTPHSHGVQQHLWNSSFISPITDVEAQPDSDLDEDYKSVRSSPSKTSLENYNLQTTKSMGYVPGRQELHKKPRNIFSIPNQANETRNITKPISSRTSNLKSMGSNLKGSYTSLRPISAYLPVVPPPGQGNVTRTMNNTQIVNVRTKIAEVPPTVREPIVVRQNDTFVKPAVPKSSGLPRPVSSGIPRPAASRIPGPRASGIRPMSHRAPKQYTDG